MQIHDNPHTNPIDVLIASRNRPHKLRKCINSILNSPAVNSVIVGLDDDTESTSELLANWYPQELECGRIKRFNYSFRSPSLVRNNLAKQSTSQYLLFADDDDKIVLGPELAQLSSLGLDLLIIPTILVPPASPEIVLTNTFDNQDRNISTLRRTDIDNIVQNKLGLPCGPTQGCRHFSLGSFICRRLLHEKINGFNRRLTKYEDQEWSIRLCTEATSYGYSKTSRYYYHLSASTSNSSFRDVSDLCQMITSLESRINTVRLYKPEIVDSAATHYLYRQILVGTFRMGTRGVAQFKRRISKSICIHDVIAGLSVKHKLKLVLIDPFLCLSCLLQRFVFATHIK